MNGAQALNTVLDDLLTHDPRVALVGASVRSGGPAGTSLGLLAKYGPAQVFEVPIADRAAVAFALGLAIGGRRVIVELDAAHSLLAALEPLAEAAAISEGGEFRAALVIRVPVGGDAGPRVDRALAGLTAQLPGVIVAAAADGTEAAGLLRAAVAVEGPVVLLEHRGLYAERANVGVEAPVGPARKLRDGAQLTLATWGAGVAAALDSAERLSADGLSVGVIDLRTLAPMDVAAVAAEVTRTGRLIVVDPGDGIGASLVHQGAMGAFDRLESPPVAITPAALDAAVRASIAW